MKKLLITLSVMFLVNSASASEDFDEKIYEQLYQKCQQNDLDSCVKFAIWTRDYLERPSLAFAPLKKACDGGHLKGCNVLGNLYLNKYSGLGMDYQKAKTLYEYSCKGGYQSACNNLENIKDEMASGKMIKLDMDALQNACIQENTAACDALQLEMMKK
ncbi:MAG TPA: sel1 repeat family protein [Pasteurellaceae bacterium]|nr:sel1 repeat family protein [Pasteurellaceae bacterium]